MALGKVESINTDNISGTIKEDETSIVYPFNDTNFPNTGLKVGDPCTYDIDYSDKNPVASNLMPYTPTEREITTTIDTPVTVNVGETVKIKNGGKVNGEIKINSGCLIIQGTGESNGGIVVDKEGALVVRNGGVVKGQIVINNASTLKVKNGGVVRGEIVINKADSFIVGDVGGSGGNSGGIISGNITIKRIRKVVITSDSKINCGS